MARLRDERKRLDALIAAIHRNRGGPDLTHLTADQRAAFTDWRRRCADYIASFTDPAEAYAASLGPDREFPPLRWDVHRILFDKSQCSHDPATAYMEMLK